MRDQAVTHSDPDAWATALLARAKAVDYPKIVINGAALGATAGPGVERWRAVLRGLEGDALADVAAALEAQADATRA